MILFRQVQRSLGAAPDILYLSAVLNRLKKGPSEKSISEYHQKIRQTKLHKHITNRAGKDLVIGKPTKIHNI